MAVFAGFLSTLCSIISHFVSCHMSWSSLTEVFVCILPLVTNKTNDLQVSTLHQTLLDDTILYETQYWKETKCSNYTQLFCVFLSLAYCFCFPAKPGEDCPKCVHMKVGGVCKESNIGKSTVLAIYFLKLRASQRFTIQCSSKYTKQLTKGILQIDYQ